MTLLSTIGFCRAYNLMRLYFALSLLIAFGRSKRSRNFV